MRWLTLLKRAEKELGGGPYPYRNFADGGAWMAEQLYLRSARPAPSGIPPNYRKAGLIKYGLSLLAAFLTALSVVSICPVTILLAIIVFYVVEVQFLFLFPLMADENATPYRSAIRISWSVGILRCVGNTIPIAVHMLVGLMNHKDPFRGWHTGCLAVLIWYLDIRKNTEHET